MEEHRIYSSYKRNNKWLGIIEYKFMLVLLIILVFLWYFLNLIITNIEVVIYIYILISIPIMSFVFVSSKSMTSIYFLSSIIRYLLFRKIYLKNIEFFDNNCFVYKNNNK